MAARANLTSVPTASIIAGARQTISEADNLRRQIADLHRQIAIQNEKIKGMIDLLESERKTHHETVLENAALKIKLSQQEARNNKQAETITLLHARIRTLSEPHGQFSSSNRTHIHIPSSRARIVHKAYFEPEATIASASSTSSSSSSSHASSGTVPSLSSTHSSTQ